MGSRGVSVKDIEYRGAKRQRELLRSLREEGDEGKLRDVREYTDWNLQEKLRENDQAREWAKNREIASRDQTTGVAHEERGGLGCASEWLLVVLVVIAIVMYLSGFWGIQ